MHDRHPFGPWNDPQPPAPGVYSPERAAAHAQATVAAEGADSGLEAALRYIASTKRGLQGIYEDYHDTNARNYHEMVYWRQLAQSYQDRARAAIGALRGVGE